MQRSQLTRLAALAALTVAAAAIVIVLVSDRPAYTLHARFYDAGQLVSGDLVTLGGHTVGSVTAVNLADDGLADITLHITDRSITPLRRGTIAQIGELSLTGVANRFVGLTPGPGPPIRNGGMLPPTQTRGIVDLDVILDSLTPTVRDELRSTLRNGARVVSGNGPGAIRRAIPFASPALSQLTGLASEVVADRFALERLVSSTAQITTALAARDHDLGGAVTNTATALREVASERGAVTDAITRAPGVLKLATHVLAHADRTLRVANPAVRDLRPVAPLLAALLRHVAPAVHAAVPTIEGVSALAPGAERALTAFPAVERVATPAVRSLTAALGPLTPILAGLRPYAPDVVAGFFNGVGGAGMGSYDANGHYLQAELTLQGGADSLTGLLSLLGGAVDQIAPLHGARSGLLAPCPGGGTPASADGSAPWIDPPVLSGTGNLCNPADDQR